MVMTGLMVDVDARIKRQVARTRLVSNVDPGKTGVRGSVRITREILNSLNVADNASNELRYMSFIHY